MRAAASAVTDAGVDAWASERLGAARASRRGESALRYLPGSVRPRPRNQRQPPSARATA